MILSHSIWLPLIYTYLNVSQLPQTADVIVVLGGGDSNRIEHGIWLYQQGFAPTVLLSGSTNHMDHAIDMFEASNVPESAMLINDQATSTYNEAQQMLAMLLEVNADSALIVTNQYHTRRARATYRHVFEGHEIALTMVAPDDVIDASSWWTSRRSQQIPTEYAKMIYYWIAYRVWSG